MSGFQCKGGLHHPGMAHISTLHHFPIWWDADQDVDVRLAEDYDFFTALAARSDEGVQ